MKKVVRFLRKLFLKANSVKLNIQCNILKRVIYPALSKAIRIIEGCPCKEKSKNL